MNKIWKMSAYSVKSIKTDYSPLGCQLGFSPGFRPGAGKALHLATSATKHPREVTITCSDPHRHNRVAERARGSRNVTARTCRSVFSHLQRHLADIRTLSWQLSKKRKAMTYPCDLPVGQPWNPARKLDNHRLQKLDNHRLQPHL